MLELKIFIGKLVPVDGFPAGTIVIGEIPSLAHKARDHTVEGGTREPESLFPSAESTKVLGGLGDNVAAFQKAPPKMRARVLTCESFYPMDPCVYNSYRVLDSNYLTYEAPW